MESTNVAVINLTEVEFFAIIKLVERKNRLSNKSKKHFQDLFIKMANQHAIENDGLDDNFFDDIAALMDLNINQFNMPNRKFLFTVNYPAAHAPSNLLQRG